MSASDPADSADSADQCPRVARPVELGRLEDALASLEVGPRRVELAEILAQYCGRVVPRLAELPHRPVAGDPGAVAPELGDLARALARTPATSGTLAELGRCCADAHRRRPLHELELDLLFDLLRAILAATPEPDADAEQLLDELSGLGRRAVTEQLADACGLPPPVRVAGARPREQLLERRRALLGPALSLSYADPLYVRRGEGTWLFDEHDHAYLDCVNNIAHVGHCHPRVVAAATAQLATLNTNTRYLHEGILDYAERLGASLPAPLRVVFMVCSGSEANELALRIARAHTGGRDVVVVDGAYHGNTEALVDISPYKFDGPGGGGRPDHVFVLDTPDPYRGRHGADGPAYAAGIDAAAETARARGSKLAAFVCESMLGCAGQIVPAPGFLSAAHARARAAGAVCIADEVQVGFGRCGRGMWAFAAEGVVPDIVTLGKPIANGHPVGAVVTTPELAASFTKMEYFNSFGGNPVSCAIASAVLDVIEDEGLIDRARERGDWLLGELAAIDDPGIGDVRGRGLFLGVELVEDRATKIPDAARARAVVEHARARGVLLSVDGPAHDVIKIKPPMSMSRTEARILVETLTDALRAHPAGPGRGGVAGPQA